MGTEEAPAPTRDILRDLASQEWGVVRDAVERANKWLGLDPDHGDELSELEDRLIHLAGHSKWEVRREVAHALRFVKDHRFELAIAPLLEDENELVRLAAQRAKDRWTEDSHRDVLSDQHGALLQTWLGDIEARHGPKTREAAMRLAERYAELLVGEARHEQSRVMGSLERTLDSLLAETERPRLNRQALSRDVKTAQDRLKTLYSVIEGLRRFSKQATPELQREALGKIVATAVSMVREKLGSGAQPLAVEVGIDPALRIDANPGRLIQAFSNLILNAVESYEGMPGQRRLVVAARVEGSRVVITFTDRGCGMTEEVRRNAFRLFNTSKTTGFGFGLPLATKIIKNEHRGAISLSSAKGKGTTVTVVLPIEQERR